MTYRVLESTEKVRKIAHFWKRKGYEGDVAFSAEEFSRTRVGERGEMGERGGAAELKHELKKEFRQ